MPLPPRRIALVGVTGSGKSVLAARIGELIRAPYVPMDDIYWSPGWVKVPAEDRAPRYAAVAARDTWVVDALPGVGQRALLARADLVLALDYPRWFSLQRLLRRTLRRLVMHESICGGNTEGLRNLTRESILLWHFRSFSAVRREIDELVADRAAPPVVRLTSQRATDAWLEDLHRSLS